MSGKTMLTRRMIAALLSVILLITSLAFLITPTFGATTGDVIYFEKPSGWSTPYCHVFSGSTAARAWPGIKMTLVADNVYSITLPGNQDKCVFNNGNNSYQTIDLSIPGNKKIFKITSGSASRQARGMWMDYSTQPTQPTQPTDPTGDVVYFEKPSSWSTPYCHAFRGSTAAKPWPGIKMTLVADNVYSITLPGNQDKCVFNNGNNSYQTIDLSIPGKNKIFKITSGATSRQASGIWMDYSVEPTNPPTQPTIPTEPPTQPTQPTVPTEPPTQPTQPTVPTEPPTQPTQPTIPTEPPTQPTEPTRGMVYFEKPSSWSTPYCHAFKGSTAAKPWPGIKMTLVSGNIYSITLPGNQDKCVFNNGNNSYQTIDLSIPGNNKLFKITNGATSRQASGIWMDYSVEPTQPTQPTQPTEPTQSPDRITVKFHSKWSNVNCYWWVSTAEPCKWPGKAMTNTGEVDEIGRKIFSINVPKDAGNLIFNNGSIKTYDYAWTDNSIVEFCTDNENGIGNVQPYEPYVFTKENAYSSGLWIDTQEEITDSPIALVKMDSSNTLYAPAGVDLSNVTVYHKYGSNFTINGNKVPSGTKVNLAVSSRGTKKSFNSSKGTIYVMQSESPALYLTTGYDMLKFNYTISKDSYKDSGAYLAVKKDGTIDNQGVLAQIKGRGNSSWEASWKIFGKYAYNIKLDSKAKLFGMNSSKKWCLLANNMDESMMRNMVVYNLAKEIGLDFSPLFKSVDLYDNGQYVGTYLVTEKVDVGKNNLVKITSLEDANEKANGNQKIEDIAHQSKSGNLKYYVGNNDTLKNPDDITGGYLLEFELDERYGDEASGFVSGKGQQVVVKSPEFATKAEVEYISALFNAAESAIYSSDGYATYNGKRVHYSDLIDVDSFAKMYLIQEFTENLDACATSFYIYKESDTKGDGKLHAAPVWDYDWTLGQYGNGKNINGNTLHPNNTNQWWARYKNIYRKSTGCTGERNFLAKLCEKSDFWNVVNHQWNSLVKDKISEEINNVDVYYNDIKSSVAMNENKWGIIRNNKGKGQHTSETITVWGSVDTGSTHSEAVSYLRNWMNRRFSWLNSQSDLSGVR